jgi:hypothetical protein
MAYIADLMKAKLVTHYGASKYTEDLLKLWRVDNPTFKESTAKAFFIARITALGGTPLVGGYRAELEQQYWSLYV